MTAGGNTDGKIWLAAAYTRLSKEDGDRVESNSIQNQKALIRLHARSLPDLCLVRHYSDDGYSGVHFCRPGFMKMLEALKSGQINCIIVKDLSRFGRNYIEAGRYIERIFPDLGIRFIAVNDNYDSLYSNSASDHLILPFKNLINDAYSRDLSIKVRSNLDVKRRQGEFVGPAVPYGYKRAETDKNRLVTDQPAAAIVRLIFAKKIQGMSNLQIAAELNRMKVSSPLAYKQERGIPAKTVFQTRGVPRWYGATVRRILENQVYTGTLVQGKTFRPSCKISRPLARPREDWFRTPNAHEALIGPGDFRLVQSILETDTRQSPGADSVYPFSGMVLCGGCGKCCTRKQTAKKGKTYVYYGCHSSGHTACCKGFSVSESVLEQSVLSVLHQYINVFTNKKELLSREAGSASAKTAGPQAEAETLARQIRHTEASLHKYRNLSAALYEDYREGLLSGEEYEYIKNSYREQADELAEALAHMKARQEEMPSRPRSSPGEAALQRQLLLPSLTRRLLLYMIENITVYPKNRMHIAFRFSNESKGFLQPHP